MFYLHEDDPIIKTHEAILDLCIGRSSDVNILDHFPPEMFDLDIFDHNRSLTETVHYYGDGRDSKPHCGHFLDTGHTRSRQFHQRHLLLTPGKTGFKEITQEESDRIAKELVEEEERLKEKAEKKRLKKQKQAEKKQLEKLNGIKDKNSPVSDPLNVHTTAPLSQTQAQNARNNSSPSQAQTQNTHIKAPSSQTQAQNVHSNRLCEEVDEEADLDMSSCFVSKAASIAKRKMAVQQKLAKEKKRGSVNLPQAKAGVAPPGVQEDQQQNDALTSPEDILRRSMNMAVLGNQFATSGQFEMAVKYFTEAIKCNPKEFRMFGNRAFCFEKLQQYEKALSDADVTLDMSPGWIKGLYRKGRALAGLKRYSEAVMAFKEVLIQDSSCTDAAQELMRVQIMQLMELGFSREQSANALVIHGTVENVLEAFRRQPGCFGNFGLPVAEEEQRAPVQKAPITPHPHPRPQPKPTAPVRSSPVPNQAQLELFPVWVGNLVSSVTDAMIWDLFRTIGEVHSVKVLQKRRCAFVNYTRRVDSARAVQEFNGKPFEGSVLLVRYPDKFQSHIPMSKSALTSVNVVNMRKLNEECFFWRTTGCSHRNCIYIHVPEHRGIDQDKGKTVP